MARAIKPTPPVPLTRTIRDPEFAKRLESACDGNSHVPPLHHGRLTWFRDQLKQRFGLDVTTETVRKWFWGEAKPRPDKTAMIAELLEVDVGWLQIGIDPGLPVRERKARNALADGAVNLIAGLIQMDGGHPAFPDEGDRRAERDHVDLYAIIKGGNYSLHVSTGEVAGAGLKFTVPAAHGNVIVLGLVRRGMALEVYEITEDVIEKHGTRRGSGIEVAVDGRAVKGLRRVDGFTQRL